MKKIFIIIIILICFVCVKEVYSKPKYESNPWITIYIDEDTCVEYFISEGVYNSGNIYPRYNADGTLKTNKKCLKLK